MCAAVRRCSRGTRRSPLSSTRKPPAQRTASERSYGRVMAGSRKLATRFLGCIQAPTHDDGAGGVCHDRLPRARAAASGDCPGRSSHRLRRPVKSAFAGHGARLLQEMPRPARRSDFASPLHLAPIPAPTTIVPCRTHGEHSDAGPAMDTPDLGGQHLPRRLPSVTSNS